MSVSSTTREDYRKLCEKIADFTHGFLALSSLVNSDEAQQRLSSKYAARLESLSKNEFVVVVIGEMKHGKSTFLNAMLRKPAFPRDVREATAAVTFLKHNDLIRDSHPEWVDKAVVSYTDGRVEVVGHLELEKYTTCLHHDELNVAEDVAQVVIYSDSEFVRDGVTVVDTPGTNTTNQRHEDITYTQIAQSHAAIFLFKANEPGKQSDFKFLADTAESINRFFFVANRVDEIGGIGEESDKIIDDIKRKVRSNSRLNDLVNQARFFPTSGLLALQARWDEYVCDNQNVLSREAWESEYRGHPDKLNELEERAGMRVFEEELLRFLFKGERMKEMFRGNIETLRHDLAQIGQQLEEQRKVLNHDMSVEELKQKRELLETQQRERERQVSAMSDELIETLSQSLAEFIKGARMESDNRLSEFAERLSGYQSYARLYANWDGLCEDARRSLSVFSRRQSEELRDDIQSVFRMLDAGLRTRLKQELSSSSMLQPPELPEFKVNLRLETLPELERDKEYQELTRKLKALEVEAERSPEAEANLKLVEAELASLQRNRQDDRDDYQLRASMMGSRPDVETTTEDGGYEEVSRGGLLGWIGDLCFGKRRVPLPPVTRVDTSARDRYDEQMAELNRQYMKKQEELEKVLREKNAQLDERRREAQLAAYKEKQRQAYEAKAADYRRKHEDCLRQAEARALEDNKEMLLNGVRRQFNDYLESLQGMTSMCRDWVEPHIQSIRSQMDEQMQTRAAQLAELETQMAATTQERESLQQRLDEAQTHYERLLATCAELDSEMNGYDF